MRVLKPGLWSDEREAKCPKCQCEFAFYDSDIRDWSTMPATNAPAIAVIYPYCIAKVWIAGRKAGG